MDDGQTEKDHDVEGKKTTPAVGYDGAGDKARDGATVQSNDIGTGRGGVQEQQIGGPGSSEGVLRSYDTIEGLTRVREKEKVKDTLESHSGLENKHEATPSQAGEKINEALTIDEGRFLEQPEATREVEQKVHGHIESTGQELLTTLVEARQNCDQLNATFHTLDLENNKLVRKVEEIGAKK